MVAIQQVLCECEDVKIPRQVKFKFKSTLVGSPSAISIDSRPPLLASGAHSLHRHPYVDCLLFLVCLPWLFACFCVDLTKDLT